MMDINSDLNTKRSSEYKNITDGESLPLLLTVADIQRILGLSKTCLLYTSINLRTIKKLKRRIQR